MGACPNSYRVGVATVVRRYGDARPRRVRQRVRAWGAGPHRWHTYRAHSLTPPVRTLSPLTSQAAYTAGVVLPKPVSKCRYWHRSLNPKKLIEVSTAPPALLPSP